MNPALNNERLRHTSAKCDDAFLRGRPIAGKQADPAIEEAVSWIKGRATAVQATPKPLERIHRSNAERQSSTLRDLTAAPNQQDPHRTLASE